MRDKYYYQELSESLGKEQLSLLKAVNANNMDEVRRLLKEGVSLKTTDSCGRSVDICDYYGTTVLHMVAMNSTLGEFKEMLQYGADINEADRYAQKVLHYASYNKNPEILKFLIEKKAFDINTVANHYGAPLHYAVGASREDLMELLLDNGADLFKRNAEGQTSLDCIVDTRNVNAAFAFSNILTKRIASFDLNCKCAETALQNLNLLNIEQKAKIVMGDRDIICELFNEKVFEASVVRGI